MSRVTQWKIWVNVGVTQRKIRVDVGVTSHAVHTKFLMFGPRLCALAKKRRTRDSENSWSNK